ncbi:MAG: hypothetical protein GY750_09240 [Lentisphaerae bacterium]|nr:hypothetical protein [Lentisphaerota bacterium]MCP4101596.1 hypothetical protein [Lentisphaerota bacterium]
MKSWKIIAWALLVTALLFVVIFMTFHSKGVDENQTLQDKLNELKAETDDIIIYKKGSNGHFSDDPQIKLKGQDIKTFFECLQLEVPDDHSTCKRKGDLKIEFFGKGKLLDMMTYHNRTHVRGLDVPINSDFYLPDSSRDKLEKFFIEKGLLKSDETQK